MALVTGEYEKLSCFGFNQIESACKTGTGRVADTAMQPRAIVICNEPFSGANGGIAGPSSSPFMAQ